MKRFFQKPQNKLSKSTQSEAEAFLSPNLFSQELFTNSELNSGQKTFVLACKIATLLILGIFFTTLFIYFGYVRAYSSQLWELNIKGQELALYYPAEKRITRLNSRLDLHKQIAPQRKNFVDKVSVTLSEIGTGETLQEFVYSNGVLTVKIIRDDILSTTALIENLAKQDYISEIAILSADLNSAEEYYTIRLEIAYK
jgi:hypothetical protein